MSRLDVQRFWNRDRTDAFLFWRPLIFVDTVARHELKHRRAGCQVLPKQLRPIGGAKQQDATIQAFKLLASTYIRVLEIEVLFPVAPQSDGERFMI